METASFSEKSNSVRYEPGMTLHQKVDRVHASLQNSVLYWQARQLAKEQTMNSGKLAPDEVRKALKDILEKTEISKKLKNRAFNLHTEATRQMNRTPVARSFAMAVRPRPRDPPLSAQTSAAGPSPKGLPQHAPVLLPLPHVEEPRENINAARRRWERSINEELLAMGSERGRPLARLRADSEAEGENKGSHTGMAEEEEPPPLRFLFDSEDLRAVITMIEPENRSEAFDPSNQINSIKLMLDTPTMQQLKRDFRELSPDFRQVGLDDIMDGMESFVDERLQLGKKIVGLGLTPVARQFAKFGVPTSLRPRIWRLALELPVDVSEDERIHFHWLKSEEQRMDLITDDLFEMDVQFIADDDRYFVFEEVLRDSVLAFSRDPWVLHHADLKVHRPLLGHHGEGQPPGTAMPPCGVQPFRGFCNYVAPLCFLYETSVPTYFVARALWCRFWCRLNAIRGKPNTLLPLCKLFEDLIVQQNPWIFLHLTALGVQPLSIVMPWIQFGFVGFLEPDQILLLWDRLIGYQNLTLLPVLAAAIIGFRSTSILQAQSAEDIKDIFQDITRLKVVPLLQTFLFHEHFKGSQ